MLTLIKLTSTEIIDYTRENYLLLENGNAALYSNFGTLFHVTHLSYFEKVISESIAEIERNFYFNSSPKNPEDSNLDLTKDTDVTIIKTLLAQLRATKRYKRGINEIGKIWKWISGSPDHDDAVLIDNKLSELITSNNRQFVTNTEIFNAIKRLSESLHEIENDAQLRLARERNKLIVIELQNIVQTIALAKTGTLNPAILNLEDIKEITQHEHGSMTITDLMDASEFKILQNEEVIVVFIKYPIIIKNCKLFETRAISQQDGKLLIGKEIAKCEKEFLNVKNCKIELRYNFCQVYENETCLSNILNNNKKAICNKIKEKNLDLEIIKDGSILISGNHIVDNATVKGTYLINFQNKTVIDGKTYFNPTFLIQNYLKTYNIDKFEIRNYYESYDEELKFDNINLIQSIQEKAMDSPIITTFVLLTIIVTTTLCILYYLKIRSSNNAILFREREEIRFSNLLKRVEELTEEAGRSS